MISVNLVGRCGNQMMQICCCIAYALRHGLEYHIPAHTLNDSVWKPMFTHLENPNWNPELPTVTLRESQHNYQELPFIEQWREQNIIIDGYRQSLKYFEDYLPEVRKAFGFEYTVKRPDTVCLHKRLGDYKLYPTRHCIISDDYIKEALSILKEKGYSRCIVFSDEIGECEQTINHNIYPEWAFRYSKHKSELEDFQMMIECGSFILSASTFGLMASILSDSENKTVIAPAKWFEFENDHLDTRDICPESYIRI